MDSKVIVYLLFVGFMFVGSFGGIILYYNASVDVLEEQIYGSLGVVSYLRANHIEAWLNEHLELVKLKSKNLAFKELLENPDDVLARQRAEETISNIIEVYAPEIVRIRIAESADNIVISSFENDSIGTQLAFEGARNGTFIGLPHVSEKTREFVLSVSEPIYVDNEFAGVLIMDLNMKSLVDIVQDNAGLGETGEVYLIDKEGFLVTPGRFEEGYFLEKKIDTENFRNCFLHENLTHEEIEERHSRVSVFLNHRGVSVLGGHVHISKMQWCLLAEINEREAVGLLRNKLIESGMLILIGILILMVIFILIANRILLKSRYRSTCPRVRNKETSDEK